MDVKKITLILLALLLIVINFSALTFIDREHLKGLRLVNSLPLFFVFAFFKGWKNKIILIAFVLFILKDISLFFYDILFFESLTKITGTLVLIVLAFNALPKIKFLRDKSTLYLFIGLSGVAYLFYEIVIASIPRMDDLIQKILVYAYGVLLFVSTIIAGNYNFRYHSTQSTMYFYLVLAFVISDVCTVLAYYLSFKAFYYPVNLFYILGLSLMTAYAVIPLEEEVDFEEYNY